MGGTAVMEKKKIFSEIRNEIESITNKSIDDPQLNLLGYKAGIEPYQLIYILKNISLKYNLDFAQVFDPSWQKISIEILSEKIIYNCSI